MEETRSGLEEKLEALESHVTETVQSATEAVAETVDTVKETVENVTESVKETVGSVTESVGETVHSVGEFFNLRHQTEQHPWIVFGGSVALGCMAAQLFGGKENASAATPSWSGPQPAFPPAPQPSSWREPSHAPAQASTEASATGEKSWFWEEIDRFKGLALGALMGVVRDLVKRNLPGELGKRAADEVDSVTTKMGAQPFHEPVLPEQ